jgi:hypothetical protein
MFRANQKQADSYEAKLVKEMARELGPMIKTEISPENFFSQIWEVMPLLLENEAISRYVQAKNSPELRQALPEILSTAEAIRVIRTDHPSTPEKDLKEMRKMMKGMMKTLKRI